MPASNSLGAIIGQSQIQGDSVSSLETDSIDVPNDTIGVVFEDCLRFVPVFSNQTKAEGIGYAVSLEKHHDFANGFLLLPSFLNALDPFLTDPLDFAQAGGFLGDYAQGVGSEVIDDFISVGLANPVNQSAGEVFPDAIGRCRKLAFEFDEGELATVLGMISPGSGQEECFPALYLRRLAHYGNFRAFVAPSQFPNEETVFFIVEGYALEYPLERTFFLCTC